MRESTGGVRAVTAPKGMAGLTEVLLRMSPFVFLFCFQIWFSVFVAAKVRIPDYASGTTEISMRWPIARA